MIVKPDYWGEAGPSSEVLGGPVAPAPPAPPFLLHCYSLAIMHVISISASWCLSCVFEWPQIELWDVQKHRSGILQGATKLNKVGPMMETSHTNILSLFPVMVTFFIAQN
jgi:hypothetical protein